MIDDPDCHYGDHAWRGTSTCVRCGNRLRCVCGCYVREDNMNAHVKDKFVAFGAFRGDLRSTDDGC